MEVRADLGGRPIQVIEEYFQVAERIRRTDDPLHDFFRIIYLLIFVYEPKSRRSRWYTQCVGLSGINLDLQIGNSSCFLLPVMIRAELASVGRPR